MTLLSLEKIVGTNGYFIDDEDLKIYSFKQDYKNGKLLKGFYDKDGYIIYKFYVNGKVKNIFYHVIIVKMFIKSNYDYKKKRLTIWTIIEQIIILKILKSFLEVQIIETNHQRMVKNLILLIILEIH